MKNSQIVSNREIFLRPGRRCLLLAALLTSGPFFIPGNTVAQEWTVSTVQNLQIALTSAQNNGEDDTIFVEQGFYDVQPAGVSFEAAEHFSLTIEGGGADDTYLDGGMSSPILEITNKSFNAPITVKNISFWRGNNASDGAGLSVYTVSSISVENCVFTRNSSSGGSGAVIVVTNGGSATLVNNIFSGNYAPGHGSALDIETFNAQATLTNNTFIGNRSNLNQSAAIRFLGGGTTLDLLNVYNNIVWGENAAEAGFYGQGASTTTVNGFNNIYRRWQFTGGVSGSAGDNIGADPLFVTSGYWDDNGTPADPSDDFWQGGDYHLQDNSPAKDTGLNSAPARPATDFDGNARINNLIVDMGAYEHSYTTSPPDIRVTDSQGDAYDQLIDFGDVLVGAAPLIEIVSVSNNGTLPLNIGTVAAPSPPFTMGDACSNASLDLAFCNITVQFSTATAGTFTDTLSIPSNDPDESLVIVSLTANGVTTPAPRIAVAPLSHDFGDVITGDSSALLEVTISSVGSADLQVSSISYDTGTDFYLDVNGGSNPCALPLLTIIKGDDCTLTIAFRPQVTGPRFDTLSIVSNDPVSPSKPLFVSGNGVSGPTPRFNVSPLTHLFNDTIIGSPSPPLEVTLSNIGNFDLHVSGIAYTTATHYTLDEKGGSTPCNRLALTIAPGDHCTVAIIFNPQAAGTFMDTLTITSDATGNPSVEVSLTGYGVTGPTPDISVSPMDYGFSSRSRMYVTISNVGIADLNITDIFLTTETQFKITNYCASTNSIVTPGESCSVEVRFDPDELNISYEDTLVIRSDDWNESEVSVELRGFIPNPIGGGSSSDSGCSIGSSMSSPEQGIPVVPIVFLLVLAQALLVWRKMRRR